MAENELFQNTQYNPGMTPATVLQTRCESLLKNLPKGGKVEATETLQTITKELMQFSDSRPPTTSIYSLSVTKIDNPKGGVLDGFLLSRTQKVAGSQSAVMHIVVLSSSGEPLRNSELTTHKGLEFRNDRTIDKRAIEDAEQILLKLETSKQLRKIVPPAKVKPLDRLA
jgi:hypothetical protein